MRGDYQSEHLQCVFVSARRQEPSQSGCCATQGISVESL